MAIPNSPANRYDELIPARMTSAGIAVASREIAHHWITFVPWPVVEAWAMLRTGRYSVLV